MADFDDHVVRINAARLRRGMDAQSVLNLLASYVRMTTPKRVALGKSVIDITGSSADRTAQAPVGR